MDEVLRIDRAAKTYRRKGREPVEALRGVSLRLERGELRLIFGPSGSGKSTLLLCAGGLLRPDAGSVTLAGADVYALDPDGRSALRARHVGFVFQQFHLIPYLSVLDNVRVPVLARAGNRSDLDARAAELVERLGLGPRRHHPPSELSVGERQRTALARALLHEPDLLLADEPTGNLDEENGRRVMDHLAGFARSGHAVLVVTHDRGLEGGRRCRLEDGRLAEEPGGSRAGGVSARSPG